ncbi:MAG TPA: MFS transporter [Propionibacteriaceae bacterium]
MTTASVSSRQTNSSALTGLPSRRATVRDWVGLAILMVPVLLVSIDNTVLSFALPAISIELTPTANTLLWITDIYPLVLAGLLVAMGSLGDRIGRRRILLIGTFGFAAVSALASLAPSAEWLIAARAGLGFFGAMLMPATLSLIRTIFTDARQRTLAVAIWAASFSVGMSLGPVLGGLLLQNFSWRAVFFMAVPLLLPMLAGRWLLPESRNPNPGRVDLISVGLSLLTLVPLVLSIKTVAHEGLSALAVGSLVLGVAAGVAFVRRQLRSANPLLDMRLFAIKPFTVAIVANLLSFFSVVGFTFFEAQQLQLVLGYEPFTAGLLLVPAAVAAVIAGLGAVALVKRVPKRHAMSAGLLIAAMAYAVLIVAPEPIGVIALVVGSVVLSIGLGLAETVANDVIVASVPADRAGAAAGVSETAYELGTVLGFAVLGTIITTVYRNNVDLPAGLSAEQEQNARETLGGAVRVSESLSAGDASALLRSAATAFDSGVGVAAIIAMVVMIAAAVVVNRAMRPAR